MIQLIDKQSTAPGEYTLAQSNRYIRSAVNQRLQELKEVVPTAMQYVSGKASKPNEQALKIQNGDQILLDAFLKHMQANKTQSAYVSTFRPYQQIFRTNRDFLTVTRDRQDRLRAGVQQTLAKAWANRQNAQVFV